jgi:DNA-binding PadR family transcriptional regulator
MAYEHLRDSLTKGNLWLYVLATLKERSATPTELNAIVRERHGFAPARITFYSVLYKLQREGLVRKSTDAFRSRYEITPKGLQELARARDLLANIGLELKP